MAVLAYDYIGVCDDATRYTGVPDTLQRSEGGKFVIWGYKF